MSVGRLAVVSILAAAAVTVPASADARGKSKPRADLVVSSAAFTSSGSSLTGEFTVKNRGAKNAAKSKAALTATASRKTKTLKRFNVSAMRRGKKKTYSGKVTVPSSFAAGTYKLKVCADSGDDVREKSNSNNCASAGTLVVSSTPGGGGPTPPTPPGGGSPEPTPPAPGGDPGPPPPQVPTDPVVYQTNTASRIAAATTSYWVNVPDSYDGSHQTPAKLFVWMHGCGGQSEGDAYTVSPENRDWISISLDGGRDGICWDVNSDVPKVLSAVRDVETHFNIDRHRIVIGGYSSGGDLAYRTIFYNANSFAGILAENTSPFKDTGSNAQQSIAAASWKFNVVHLAHRQDDTYKLAEVQAEIAQLQNAGFPVTLIERDGGHGDETTDPDLINDLLPHLNDGWTSP